MEKEINRWEQRGLGKAPFRCVGVFQMPDKSTATMQDYAALPKGYGAGTCHVCGTGIIYNYMINSADGKKFVVGCDCVEKTGDVAVYKEVQAWRKDAEKVARTAKKAAATRARHDAERARNGGLTDAEVRKANAETERAAMREAMRAVHGELFDAVRATGNEWAIGIVDERLHWGQISEKQVELLTRIVSEHARRAAAKNEFFGQIGKRYTKTLTIEKWLKLREGSYYESPLYLCLAHDDEGRTYKYMGNARCLPNERETAEVTFTVKTHEQYNGINQTQFQRPTIKRRVEAA